MVVEPEVSVETTYHEELAELRAASPWDRDKLVHAMMQKRLKFGDPR